MTRPSSSTENSLTNQTWYGSIWHRFKHFPQGLARGSNHPPTVNGPGTAALIGASLSCFLMMVSHHLAETSKTIDQIVLEIGSWMPGSQYQSDVLGNIGSYAGKQTILLVSFLVVWCTFYFSWKQRNIQPRMIFFWMFLFMAAATMMTWHPLFPYLTLM
jgi:hypothetical protein